VLSIGLLLLAGCKDLFNSERPEIKPEMFTVTFDAFGGSLATRTRTVNSGGTLFSKDGAKITGNTAAGGGVYGFIRPAVYQKNHRLAEIADRIHFALVPGNQGGEAVQMSYTLRF
jgi:hypothetical protein